MLYGSVGANMKHSYSKFIHESLGYPWELISIEENDLRQLLESRDFKGLSVTIPYKKLVIPYCDKVSPLAEEIGAVNTLYFDEEGNLCGTNTDYLGFLYAMDSAGIEIEGKKAVILGAGATCRTIKKALTDRGIGTLVVACRKTEKPFIKEENGIKCLMINFNDLKEHTDADLVINATPVGMRPDVNGQIVDLEMFPSCKGVFDVVYNPYKTKLVQQAESLGIPAAGGLKMLVAQATAAGNYFMNKPGFYDKENERVIELVKNEYNL